MKKFKKSLLLFVFALLGFTFIYSSIRATAAALSVAGVDIIYANPGEDCMTQVTISWHSSETKSKLIYTKAEDKNYEHATEIEVEGVYDETSFIYYDVCKFYKCVVELKNLEAGTNYIYKIVAGKVTSREHKFKTAGVDNFTFGYMSDIHTVNKDNLDLGMTAVEKLQTVQTLLGKAKKVSGDIDLIVTTGDEVWRGSQYTNWLEWSKSQYVTATEDYLWAGAVGNHEYYTQVTDSVWNYYPDKYASDPSQIYDDPDYFYNTYFNAIKAVPQNGPEGIPSCYWFLYNNVLFISIDSMQTSEYKQLDKIKAWFEEVVLKNEGKYQYIIAYQHYPWYDFQTGVDKYAYRWRDLFDKYGVDLALSGHMHGYLRTKQLYNGAVSDDEMKGTYYVVSPQIGDRAKAITSYSNVDLFASWQSTRDKNDFKAYSAMSTVTVTKEGITYKLIDVEGKVRDEFTIKAKRPYVLQEVTKQSIRKTLTLSSSNDTISINIDPAMAPYVRTIQAIVDNSVVKSVNPSASKKSYLNISGISSSSVHDVRMIVTYVDNQQEEFNERIATVTNNGLIEKLDITSANNKMKLDWTAKDSSASTYKVFVDDKEVGSVSANTYSMDLASLITSSKYSVQALDANGNILSMVDGYYQKYGDANLDGKIDDSDASALIDLILAETKFNQAQINLLDNNKDGKVDIGDAFRILSFANHTVDNIKINTYTVIVVDKDGNLLASAKVAEGADLDITLPEVSGKTFKGYSLSAKDIKSDMVLVAIYE